MKRFVGTTKATNLLTFYQQRETPSSNVRNLVPRAFSSTIFKMADRREKTLANAELTPSLIGPFIRTRWLG